VVTRVDAYHGTFELDLVDPDAGLVREQQLHELHNGHS